MTEISRYGDYWPQYLREHSRPATRVCHYLHTGLGGLSILYALGTQHWLLLIGILAMIFISAFFSHIVFEKNKPAAFKYPFWWSAFNDIRMLFHFLTGTLGRQIKKSIQTVI